MELIAHRINNVTDLRKVPSDCGVELDLRDSCNRLIVTHDPFTDGPEFASYLPEYHHGTMILNVKCERIEFRILEELKKSGNVRKYFFLDCSFPMIKTLLKIGEQNIAMRFSEFEPVEGVMAMAGLVKWVWVDCFTKMPFDQRSYDLMRPHFKFCAVSPELQGRPVESIEEYAKELSRFPVDAVCTKHINIWQKCMSAK